ncbi:YfhD family protein [Peribacillus asahii]|uniref:YfhD family protein n=1 Tax=Peribacillus asahii TaxID=228899 RepID=A0A398B1N3_9BACI|nr:YfhD family protein [Peribacillus asahii]RID81793.1 YfhD family protein [Peribacillus asahii]
MGQNHKPIKRNKNNQGPSQFEKNLQSDGIDVEYSAELADADDLEAQARANAADQRAKRNK